MSLFPFSRSLLLSASLLFAMVLVNLTVSAANLPLTDLIFFGKVYQNTTHTPITGVLPGKIEVKINSATGPSDTVIALTEQLLAAPGAVSSEYYVLRIRRFDLGTIRQVGDAFIIPGDRIRIFLNGQEVAETQVPIVLTTDAQGDVRLINLNGPLVVDSDNDGLPDSWEMSFFGDLAQTGNGDWNKDGVSNQLAFAFGLNPKSNNTSRLPFLSLEQNGSLVFYFRQSIDNTGLTFTVSAIDTLGSGNWQPVPGVIPEPIGVEGNSRIVRAVIPGGVDRPRRFFRLDVTP